LLCDDAVPWNYLHSSFTFILAFSRIKSNILPLGKIIKIRLNIVMIINQLLKPVSGLDFPYHELPHP